MERPGFALPDDPQLNALVEQHHCDQLDDFQASRSGRIHFHEVTQLDISSSDIRRRFASGANPSFLLPTPVIDYIARHGLYR